MLDDLAAPDLAKFQDLWAKTWPLYQHGQLTGKQIHKIAELFFIEGWQQRHAAESND